MITDVNNKIMKKQNIILIFIMSLIASGYTQTKIKGISFENYPRVDGSTSTYPLSKIMACKFLNIEYFWVNVNSTWLPEAVKYEYLNPEVTDEERNKIPIYNGKITCSQTHQAIINLIENKTDIILSARKMSADEKNHADSLGIKLIEMPIALDALIFLANEQRGIKSLTTKEIQDIYIGKITRWETLGGDTVRLYPLIRDANSGSQELLETIVMKGLKKNWKDFLTMEQIVRTMPEVFMALSWEQPNAICFSIYYYKEMMIRDQYPNVQTLAINGIEPNSKTIADGTYPYVAEVYAVIRSDLPKNDPAYKLYKWLQTKKGQAVIKESGYVPIKTNLIKREKEPKFAKDIPKCLKKLIRNNSSIIRIEEYRRINGEKKIYHIIDTSSMNKIICDENCNTFFLETEDFRIPRYPEDRIEGVGYLFGEGLIEYNKDSYRFKRTVFTQKNKKGCK